VSGAAGSNECPAGSPRIEAEAACRTAAAAAGKIPSTSTSYPFVETESAYPRGCYYDTTDNYAYFNTHAVGAGYSYAQLLCATGARDSLTARVLHTGTQRALEKRYSHNGTRRALEKGTQRVLKGYSRGTPSSGEGDWQGTQRSFTGSSEGTHRVLKKDIQKVGSCGSIRGIMGGQCTVMLCPLGLWLVLCDSSIYFVLPRCSQGTHSHWYSPGTPRVPTLLSPAAVVRSDVRVCSDRKCSRGTHGVLKGYSKGTQRVLPRYCARKTPSGACRSLYTDAAGSARLCGAPGRMGQSVQHC
jgi:hypothetical protein